MARNGTQTLDANYDLSGNLTSRSDVGSYSYHATKKHAVIAAGTNTYAYDANGNVTTRNGATLSWASYDLPTSLVSGGNSAQFAYAPDRSRYQQTAVTAGVTETTLYIAGLLEKVTKPSITLWKHYVTAPTGMGAVYVRRSDGSSDTYYLTTDHLGSTDKLLKAATGTVQVAESFAPFGARRGSDWQGAPSAADLTAIGNSTPDGFTGHEMLDGVGLIHMNGRVYDPTVGRFLSVDPIVRDAAASQSWNGYGYVEGRMLSARDPSGWSTEEIVVSATRDGGPGLRSNVNFGLDSYFRQLRAARAWTPASERQIDMNRGAGQGGGRDCPAGLEEVVVDGQRGQPPVPVVPLTFVPLSITPPNSARFSRLLNAAEAENRNCVSRCRRSLEPLVQMAAGAAGGAAGGFVAGTPAPGLGQASAAAIGAFVGATTGLVAGSVGNSRVSAPTKFAVATASGLAAGGNAALLQGGRHVVSAIASSGLASGVGTFAPGTAVGTIGAAIGGTALATAAAGVTAAVGLGTFAGWAAGNVAANAVCASMCQQ